MEALWVALIAAGAAIISSWLTHYFERRRRRMEGELKWLEERFMPALDFLGRVYAIISSTPNTEEERRQMADKVRSIVEGQSKENNVWCVATLLDPEETGLGDLILDTMTYARIAESKEEFTKYQVRLQLNLKELAEEFRRERQAIASGKSLESLIRRRKDELKERVRRMSKALYALRNFLDGKADLYPTLREVEGSGVRGARLSWIFDVTSKGGDEQNQARLDEVRRVCEDKGWLT